MVSRTFGLALLCALCLVQVVSAGTRLSVRGGMTYPYTLYERAYSASPALSVAVDAPPVIRRQLPLEAVVEAAWLVNREKRYTSSIDTDSDRFTRGWQRDGWLVTSETLRLYTVGSHAPGEPQRSSLELGLGVGLHQFWPHMKYDGETRMTLRHAVHSQWRGHIFSRWNILPTQPAGPVLELEYQHIFDDVHEYGYPNGAVLAKLGWRFRV